MSQTSCLDACRCAAYLILHTRNTNVFKSSVLSRVTCFVLLFKTLPALHPTSTSLITWERSIAEGTFRVTSGRQVWRCLTIGRTARCAYRLLPTSLGRFHFGWCLPCYPVIHWWNLLLTSIHLFAFLQQRLRYCSLVCRVRYKSTWPTPSAYVWYGGNRLHNARHWYRSTWWDQQCCRDRTLNNLLFVIRGFVFSIISKKKINRVLWRYWECGTRSP
jgi:hypothetical protein